MTLNKNQINSVNKKLFLNFNEELISNNEKKEILHLNVMNNLDVLIHELLEQGVKFYKISFLEEIQKIETACVEVEDTINYCMTKISMIEFLYLIIEKEMSGVFTIHCILGTRTLLNSNLLYSIKEIFNQLNLNTAIKYLDDYDHIRENWIRLISKKNYKFHRFIYFSEFFHNIYANLAELEVNFFPECGYGLSFIANALDSDIKGISGKKNCNDKICLNLLEIFLYLNKFCLFSNGIYVKTKKSKFSYNFFDDIDYFDKNIFMILKDLKEKYNMQLKKLDIIDFLLCCWERFFKKIFKKKKIFFFENVKFYEYIIEFNDGLYFLDKNYFFSFDENKLFLSKPKNIGCYKYFDESFKKCLHFPPQKWLNLIKKSFRYEKLIEKFFLNLGMYFNSTIIATKRKLILVRNSDDLTPTMTVNFSVFNTLEEINFDRLFFVEQKEDKKFLGCNYFLLNNQKIIDVKKHINNFGNIIFEFDEELPNKILNDKIFLVKLLIYTFTFGCCEYNILIEKILDKELAQIIIYCNSLFFCDRKTNFDSESFFYKKDKNY